MSKAQSSRSHAVIAGLGKTGVSCARYLHGHGWRIAATDSRENPPGLAQVLDLDPPVQVSVGRLDTQLLDGAVCVIASPGVPLRDPFLLEAARRGLEVMGDIELFARAADAPVAGITGTNGKSTVTTLVGRMARRAAVDARVGGNLGEPALDLLGAPGAGLYVLELSSFQLETTYSLHLKAATVLNVTADHMDRYASMADYAAAKSRIFARCDTAVVNLDDPLVAAMPQPGQRRLSFSLRASAGADYALVSAATAGALAGAAGSGQGREQGREWWLTRRGERLLGLAEMKIAGLHNAANALASLALGEALGLPLEPMLAELREFTGLPHRSQWVAEIRGVTYVDDSKGTNVGATLAAVAGMPGPVVLIAGGDGKGQDFAPLREGLAGKARLVVLIGRDAPAIALALDGACPTARYGSLDEAVRAAARAAVPGDTVLLSPACASLDMFRDYAHRGVEFARAVKELAA